MTWKLAFTLIVIIGGVLTGLAPLFLLTEFRAELGVGTLLLGLLIGIIVLLSAGVPIGFATGVLGAIVIWLNFGQPGLGLVLARVFDLINSHSFIAIPFFILMASLLERSGIAHDVYHALNLLLGRARGGVAVATALLAVILASMSGIIGGEIVLLGLVALPQMLRLGYDKHLAIGTICAGGSLGAMIPPSIVMIIYGLITETSITKLFTASIVPGLILAGAYVLYIVVRTQLNPHLAPLPDRLSSEEAEFDNEPWGDLLIAFFPFAIGFTAALAANALGAGSVEQIATFVFASAFAILVTIIWLGLRKTHPIAMGLLPLLLIIDLVLGSIYGGVTGITEAAVMGVVASLVVIFLRRELEVQTVMESLEQMFRSVGAILWVTFGATVLAGAFTLSGGDKFVSSAILGLNAPPLAVVLMMLVVFFILGMFMDWVGIVLMTMPVFLPIVHQLDYDPIWFGILFCVSMQMAFLTPPFGSAAFYLKSVAPPDIDLVTIYRSFGPFILIQLAVLVLLVAFPQISLFLVR
jgi:TRAP-type mannitol/chloroaromatic compound transport system permease large subunit